MPNVIHILIFGYCVLTIYFFFITNLFVMEFIFVSIIFEIRTIFF
jgi:hypothetical protein